MRLPLTVTLLAVTLSLALAACNMAAQVAPPTPAVGETVATATPAAGAPAATAVAEMPGSGEGGASGEATPADAPLVATEWRLVAFGPSGGEAAPLDEAEVTLGFPDGETVRGSAGCNTYSGVYQAGAEGAITFDTFAATEMACPNTALMEQESAFLQALSAVTSFTLEEGRLILSGPDANLIFEAL